MRYVFTCLPIDGRHTLRRQYPVTASNIDVAISALATSHPHLRPIAVSGESRSVVGRLYRLSMPLSFKEM